VLHGGKEPPAQGGSLENFHDMMSRVDEGLWAGEYATREPISRDGGGPPK